MKSTGAERGLARWKALALACAVLLAAALAPWGSEVTVIITHGQAASEIGRALESQGVIRSPLLFKISTKLMRAEREMKPGIYRLRRHMFSPLVVWKLTHHIQFIKVVVPEGFNAWQIADRLEANSVAPARAFMEYVSANRLEGHLFPTTYYLGVGMRPEDVAHLMHQEFAKMVDPEFAGHPPSPLGRDQVITLASIVEREAVLPAEKPTIAAVYLNRLAKRKYLEADPTVQYAVDPRHWKKRLNLKDLQIDSPYNTYTHFGLPPTPICSPSVASVRAVLQPARTDALYFVANNTGGHTFNSNYGEHLKAKDKAKRERQLLRLFRRRQTQEGDETPH